MMPSIYLKWGLVCFFVSLLHSVSALSAPTLRLVQVVHRHGARSPIVQHNKSQICGEVPCGHLNSAGMAMLVNAGKFLRRQYNEDTSEPFFPSESYDPTVVYSRSTDVTRTLQSAECLLRGMFPNVSALFPAIHTVNLETDWLLRYNVVPQAYAFTNLDEHWWTAVCNPKLDTLIDHGTLVAVSREVFSEGLCMDPRDRCTCAFTLHDIGVAMESDGRIVNYPLLRRNLDRLRSIKFFENSQRLVYNISDDTSVKMGSLGQHLAREILKNVNSHMDGKSTFKLYHYSAHDTTLASLAATLGDDTIVGLTPPYGQLYAFELLHDRDSDEFSIRMRRGAPAQEPGGGYAFSWGDSQMKCMNRNGVVYVARDNVCPYRDLQRYVESTKPQNPAGLCYLNKRYRELFRCPGDVARPPSKQCKAFRRVCPAWSCDKGYTLDSVALKCVCSSKKCMGKREGDAGAEMPGGRALVDSTWIAASFLPLAIYALVLMNRRLLSYHRRGRVKE